VTLILSDVVPWFHGCDPISAPGSSTITIAATCASGWGEREGIKLQRFIPTNTPTWYEKYRVLYYIGKKTTASSYFKVNHQRKAYKPI